jgi:hypothetical protein
VDGDFQQVGMFVRPHSLYDEQLRERLGHEPDGQEDYYYSRTWVGGPALF